MGAEFSPQLEKIRLATLTALQALLPHQSDNPNSLPGAMQYSLLGGGKRIRPLLTCCTAISLGGSLEQALPGACAVECMHAYSLIHDDLPAMDNDELRHGKPSCHRAFGEAGAILAGDALQSLAYQTLSEAEILPSQTRLASIKVLAEAAGWQGMVAGQWLDIASTGAALSPSQLEHMHRHKTAALIAAATQLGALVSPVDSATVTRLQHFGEELGLLFQMVDDLLDATQSTATLGKPSGSDAALGKNTYVTLLGLERTRQEVEQRLELCFRILRDLEIETGGLGELTTMVAERTC